MSKRDNERLDAIRALACCQCGAPPSQAAHSNSMCHGKGRGIKAYDKYTIPLCHSCHVDLDQNLSQQTRQEQYDWFMQKMHDTDETLKRLNDATNKNYPEIF